jgi:phage terminase small subunit
MALNDRQQRFINEYLIDLNATAAAKRAGYSEKTAHSQGPRLLENVEIQEELRKAQQKTITKLEITREDIINDLIKIKEANIDEWPPHALKALEMLNKMLGYNEPDKNEITIKKEPPLFSDEDLEDEI